MLNTLPPSILNLILEHGNPFTSPASIKMLKNPDKAEAMLEERAHRNWEKASKISKRPLAPLTPTLILSYKQTAFLLRENKAISRTVKEAGDPELRSCLPELTSPAEAVALMIREHHLNESEARTLWKMLYLIKPEN